MIRIPKERNRLEVIANLSGSPCEVQCKSDRVKCGRVLGLRFDSNDILYALDAYSGIKKIDVSTGVVTTVIDFRGRPHAGRDIVFVDDFVIDESVNGKSGPHVFYITDSSALFEVELCHMPVMMAEASGRVLRFDAKTQELSVLKDGLSFANGIELTDDGSHILVNELSNRIVWKIPLRQTGGGKSGGQVAVKWMENLPGYPDNIRRSTRRDKETYWIATFAARRRPTIYERVRNQRPFLFKVVIRCMHNIEFFWSLYGHFVPRPFCQYFAIPGRFAMQLRVEERPGLAIEVDANGKILRSIQDPSERITHLSEVREVIEDGYKVLYLGSFVNPYLGRLVLEPATGSTGGSGDGDEASGRVTTSPTPKPVIEGKAGTSSAGGTKGRREEPGAKPPTTTTRTTTTTGTSSEETRKKTEL